ncbi:hypothetical protein F5Y08DRAFT_313882 [Xylaria arbuscula]|nr:hypothetical protein F5Y08DRAFT_313882 [Xylaria arbuscula]
MRPAPKFKGCKARLVPDLSRTVSPPIDYQDPASEASGSGSLCDNLAKCAIRESTREPTGLAVAPTEIILNILGHTKKKRDWLALGRTCRRISLIVVAELDKYNSLDGYGYALQHAISKNNTPELRRQIANDPAAVNHRITRRFWIEGRPYMKDGYPVITSPLAIAVCAGNSVIVGLLLRLGADPNLSHPPSLEGLYSHTLEQALYPINEAVECMAHDSVAIIQMLGNHSADMNQHPYALKRSLNYNEPLTFLTAAPIFRVLQLEQPSRPRDIGKTRPNSCETYNDDFKKIQDLRLRQLHALLQGGASPNLPYRGGPMTPIFYLLTNLASFKPAFYFPDKLMVRQEAEAQAVLVNGMVIKFLDALLGSGADIRAMGSVFSEFPIIFRETPLHVVCGLREEHRTLMHWFLSNGASIHDLDEAGNTPLISYCSSRIQNTRNFSNFLNYPHDINHRNSKGQSAFHALCANTWLTPQVKEKLIQMMLDAGADPTPKGPKGRTPAQEILHIIRNLQPQRNVDFSRMCVMTPYRDVLEMVQDAEEKWIRRKNKSAQKSCLADKRAVTHGSDREGCKNNVENGKENTTNRTDAPDGKMKEKQDRKRGSHIRPSQGPQRNNNQNRDKAPAEQMEASRVKGKQAIRSSTPAETEQHGEKRSWDKHYNQGAQCNVNHGRPDQIDAQYSSEPSGSGSGSGRVSHYGSEQTGQRKKPQGGG